MSINPGVHPLKLADYSEQLKVQTESHLLESGRQVLFDLKKKWLNWFQKIKYLAKIGGGTARTRPTKNK
jgi:hypothetical protein